MNGTASILGLAGVWLVMALTAAQNTPTAPSNTTSATLGPTAAPNVTAEQTALFSHLLGIAVDGAGELYVADSSNHTIRKVSAAGVVTTLAGSAKGNADGAGNVARFESPSGVAVDNRGTLYVADSGNHTIRKVTSQGTVTTLAGLAGAKGSQDGTGDSARFNYPYGVALDGTGNIYVTDYSDHTVRKVTPGGIVTTLTGKAGEPDSSDGAAEAARFWKPQGIAVDNQGAVYVCDGGNNTIRKITSSGVVSTLAGTDAPVETITIHDYLVPRNADGQGAAAGFNHPGGVAVDGAGTVFVADTDNGTIRRITPAGVVTTLAGSSKSVPGGSGSAAGITFPAGVAVDKTGNVYVAGPYTIRKINPSGDVITLAGEEGTFGSADGAGCVARFKGPVGVAIDHANIVYVADAGNNLIRKITPDGFVRTVAGAGGLHKVVDGRANVAKFGGAHGLAVDGVGNIYVSDSLTQTIRKITPGGMVSTLAGKPDGFGSTDGVGSAARFNNPHGLAVDKTGNVYVADAGNNTIRKITPDGTVSTLAGSPEQRASADGTGSEARFDDPDDVALDSEGNLYVPDSLGRTIRKISPGGVVTTLAGSAGLRGSDDGKGSAARFGCPVSVAVDKAGNIYVGDLGNETVRKITPDGSVTTLAGKTGSHGATNGKGGEARFNTPEGVAVDSTGNVYLAEREGKSYNIRKITPDGVVTTLAGLAEKEGSADGLAHSPR